MMNSGLIPPDCRRDIDSVPAVTKCDLPYELVAGARVVPADFYLQQHRKQYGGRQAFSQQTSPRHVDWASNLTGTWTPSNVPVSNLSGTHIPGTSLPASYRQSPTRRSVACQYEQSTTPKHFESYHGSPLKVYHLPSQIKHPKTDSATQTMVASETQTDTGAQVDPTSLRMPQAQPISSYQREGFAQTSSGYVAPDLLDATRRYFEEYDRRLKDTSDAFIKHQQFRFSDVTTAQEMEWKREQVNIRSTCCYQ